MRVKARMIWRANCFDTALELLWVPPHIPISKYYVVLPIQVPSGAPWLAGARRVIAKMVDSRR